MEPAGQHSGKHRPSGRLPAGGRDASELSPAVVAASRRHLTSRYATGLDGFLWDTDQIPLPDVPRSRPLSWRHKRGESGWAGILSLRWCSSRLCDGNWRRRRPSCMRQRVRPGSPARSWPLSLGRPPVSGYAPVSGKPRSLDPDPDGPWHMCPCARSRLNDRRSSCAGPGCAPGRG